MCLKYSDPFRTERSPGPATHVPLGPTVLQPGTQQEMGGGSGGSSASGSSGGCSPSPLLL